MCAFLSTESEISPQDLFKQSVDEDQMYENPGAATYVSYSLNIINTLMTLLNLCFFEQEQLNSQHNGDQLYLQW